MGKQNNQYFYYDSELRAYEKQEKRERIREREERERDKKANNIRDMEFFKISQTYIKKGISTYLEEPKNIPLWNTAKRDTGIIILKKMKECYPKLFSNLNGQPMACIEDLIIFFMQKYYLDKHNAVELKSDKNLKESETNILGQKLAYQFGQEMEKVDKIKTDLFTPLSGMLTVFDHISANSFDSFIKDISASKDKSFGKNKNNNAVLAPVANPTSILKSPISSKEYIIADIMDILCKLKYMPEIKDEESIKNIENFLFNNEYKLGNETFSLKEFIEYEFDIACKNILSLKISRVMDEKKYDSFGKVLHLMPKEKDKTELMQVFYDTLNRTYYDIYILGSSFYSKANLKLSIDKTNKKLEDKIQKAKDKEKERTELIQKQRKELEKLRKKISTTDFLEEENAELKIKLKRLENIENDYGEIKRNEDKLKEELSRLQEKYQNMKDNCEIQTKLLKEEREKNNFNTEEKRRFEEALKNFDPYGKYAFVCFEDNVFNTKLKEAFPNMVFVNEKTDFNNMIIDVVVILVKHVKHMTMYAVKDNCMRKEIPVIYTDVSNIDMIKELIVRELIRKK